MPAKLFLLFPSFSRTPAANFSSPRRGRESGRRRSGREGGRGERVTFSEVKDFSSTFPLKFIVRAQRGFSFFVRSRKEKLMTSHGQCLTLIYAEYAMRSSRPEPEHDPLFLQVRTWGRVGYREEGFVHPWCGPCERQTMSTPEVGILLFAEAWPRSEQSPLYCQVWHPWIYPFLYIEKNKKKKKSVTVRLRYFGTSRTASLKNQSLPSPSGRQLRTKTLLRGWALHSLCISIQLCHPHAIRIKLPRTDILFSRHKTC